MTSSVLALPVTLARAGARLVGRLTLSPFAGAATLVFRAAHRSTSPAPVRITPDPGYAAPRTSPPLEVVPPPGPEVVVDPIPLAEPALDLDVDVLLASELPIRSYDALNAADAIQAMRDLTDVEDVRLVLSFEEQNGKRKGVLAAARAHLAMLEQTVRR